MILFSPWCTPIRVCPSRLMILVSYWLCHETIFLGLTPSDNFINNIQSLVENPDSSPPNWDQLNALDIRWFSGILVRLGAGYLRDRYQWLLLRYYCFTLMATISPINKLQHRTTMFMTRLLFKIKFRIFQIKKIMIIDRGIASVVSVLVG